MQTESLVIATESKASESEEDKTVVCAWCGRVILQGGKESYLTHGICLACMGDNFQYPIEDLGALRHEATDVLPYGLIRLDSELKVIEYNTRESELSGFPRDRVVGRDFFREVAPCTCVQEFEGKLKGMIALGKPARAHLQFLFKFPNRITLVELVMTYDPASGESNLLIRKIKEEGGKD